jgi:hypothetical protein
MEGIKAGINPDLVKTLSQTLLDQDEDFNDRFR